MREILRYGFILAIICIVAAGLLSGVNSLTKHKIIAQAQAEEEESLKEVLPMAVIFKPIKSGDEILYYKAENKEGELIGVVFKSTGKGYSSTIETLVGMLGDGTITAIKILSQNETPGVGAQIVESNFTNQFKNKKDLSDVQAITGATISSQAVIDSVNKRTEEIRELIENEE